MDSLADFLHEESSYGQTTTAGNEWGVVTDNEDPDQMGRVRVRMSWHRKDQQSDWIPRQGGGGGNYGETGSIPQEGELVSICYTRGNLHQPHWTPSHWTKGGSGPRGNVPASLPPHLTPGSELFSVPTHKPQAGKFKIWFWRSLSGFFLHIGEGLDWLHFKTPKGFDLKLEHDVEVGGKAKTAAHANLPYHHLKLTTPTGHSIETTEWTPGDLSQFQIDHSGGMRVELTQHPQTGQKDIKVTLGGLQLWLRDAPGTRFAQLSDGAGETLKLDAVNHISSLTASGVITIDAPSILLAGGGPPVARVGDLIQVIGVMPGAATATGKIISGSPVVKSG